MTLLQPRHIQNLSEASSIQHHWGYADRAVPCTNDAGSCEYLDVVYHSHDLGMLYTGIIWATILGILLIWAIVRRVSPARNAQLIPPVSPEDQQASSPRGSMQRLGASFSASTRRYLLPDSIRLIFGRVTRLQVLILAIMAAYLLIWSFVGIVYKTWITPVKKMPGVYNTRTSLGPFADRVGVLAYALTPLSILLSSRESIISIITGVPYHHFNFLHRWLGHIIFIQSALHTIGWCIVEIRLYQPQPTVGLEWIRQTYMVWGLVAMILLTLLWGLSTPWAIRAFGYEFFRKSHYVLAMIYIGACWGHWAKLKVFLLPSLLIWFADRGIRLVRAMLLHYNYLPSGKIGFSSSQAEITHFADSDNGDVVRLDFHHPQDAWKVGQHFFLCFTEGSIWQSHPFTPLSYPQVKQGTTLHSYIFRAKKGETKKVADLAAALTKKEESTKAPTTGVILTGPYGGDIVEDIASNVNVLAIAGGTGVTYVLPALFHLVRTGAHNSTRRVELVWVIRKAQDVNWIKAELDELRSHPQITIHIFVTRENADSSSSSVTKDDSSIEDASEAEKGVAVEKANTQDHRPDLAAIVRNYVDSTVQGPTNVIASGPGSMITDLRAAVAKCNDGGRVLRGEDRFDVKLTTDERLEW